jgi:hypothetical protein
MGPRYLAGRRRSVSHRRHQTTRTGDEHKACVSQRLVAFVAPCMVAAFTFGLAVVTAQAQGPLRNDIAPLVDKFAASISPPPARLVRQMFPRSDVHKMGWSGLRMHPNSRRAFESLFPKERHPSSTSIQPMTTFRPAFSDSVDLDSNPSPAAKLALSPAKQKQYLPRSTYFRTALLTASIVTSPPVSRRAVTSNFSGSAANHLWTSLAPDTAALRGVSPPVLLTPMTTAARVITGEGFTVARVLAM